MRKLLLLLLAAGPAVGADYACLPFGGDSTAVEVSTPSTSNGRAFVATWYCDLENVYRGHGAAGFTRDMRPDWWKQLEVLKTNSKSEQAAKIKSWMNCPPENTSQNCGMERRVLEPLIAQQLEATKPSPILWFVAKNGKNVGRPAYLWIDGKRKESKYRAVVGASCNCAVTFIKDGRSRYCSVRGVPTESGEQMPGSHVALCTRG